jgi:hypothetical protein
MEFGTTPPTSTATRPPGESSRHRCCLDFRDVCAIGGMCASYFRGLLISRPGPQKRFRTRRDPVCPARARPGSRPPHPCNVTFLALSSFQVAHPPRCTAAVVAAALERGGRPAPRGARRPPAAMSAQQEAALPARVTVFLQGLPAQVISGAFDELRKRGHGLPPNLPASIIAAAAATRAAKLAADAHVVLATSALRLRRPASVPWAEHVREAYESSGKEEGKREQRRAGPRETATDPCQPPLLPPAPAWGCRQAPMMLARLPQECVTPSTV